MYMDSVMIWNIDGYFLYILFELKASVKTRIFSDILECKNKSNCEQEWNVTEKEIWVVWTLTAFCIEMSVSRIWVIDPMSCHDAEGLFRKACTEILRREQRKGNLKMWKC